jgi:hypothetical protein
LAVLRGDCVGNFVTIKKNNTLKKIIYDNKIMDDIKKGLKKLQKRVEDGLKYNSFKTILMNNISIHIGQYFFINIEFDVDDSFIIFKFKFVKIIRQDIPKIVNNLLFFLTAIFMFGKIEDKKRLFILLYSYLYHIESSVANSMIFKFFNMEFQFKDFKLRYKQILTIKIKYTRDYLPYDLIDINALTYKKDHIPLNWIPFTYLFHEDEIKYFYFVTPKDLKESRKYSRIYQLFRGKDNLSYLMSQNYKIINDLRPFVDESKTKQMQQNDFNFLKNNRDNSLKNFYINMNIMEYEKFIKSKNEYFIYFEKLSITMIDLHEKWYENIEEFYFIPKDKISDKYEYYVIVNYIFIKINVIPEELEKDYKGKMKKITMKNLADFEEETLKIIKEISYILDPSLEIEKLTPIMLRKIMHISKMKEIQQVSFFEPESQITRKQAIEEAIEIFKTQSNALYINENPKLIPDVSFVDDFQYVRYNIPNEFKQMQTNFMRRSLPGRNIENELESIKKSGIITHERYEVIEIKDEDLTQYKKMGLSTITYDGFYKLIPKKFTGLIIIYNIYYVFKVSVDIYLNQIYRPYIELYFKLMQQKLDDFKKEITILINKGIINTRIFKKYNMTNDKIPKSELNVMNLKNRLLGKFKGDMIELKYSKLTPLDKESKVPKKENIYAVFRSPNRFYVFYIYFYDELIEKMKKYVKSLFKTKIIDKLPSIIKQNIKESSKYFKFGVNYWTLNQRRDFFKEEKITNKTYVAIMEGHKNKILKIINKGKIDVFGEIFGRSENFMEIDQGEFVTNEGLRIIQDLDKKIKQFDELIDSWEYLKKHGFVEPSYESEEDKYLLFIENLIVYNKQLGLVIEPDTPLKFHSDHFMFNLYKINIPIDAYEGVLTKSGKLYNNLKSMRSSINKNYNLK